MYSPGSSGHFKSEFLVHCYTFYNFQIAITPNPNIKEILENTRFGLTYVWTEKKIFQIFFNSNFFLIQIFLVQIF